VSWLLAAAILLAGLGTWLWLRSRAARRQAGLPAGRVIYADTGAWSRCERPLFSQQHRLTGRPDYLVLGRGAPIPVEVKSCAAPPAPYRAHLLQLAAYCLLVEEQEGQMPPYGILKYGDRAFRVDYTSALRSELLRVLDSMRRDLRAPSVDRDHDEPGRCAGCGHRDRCDHRLGR